MMESIIPTVINCGLLLIGVIVIIIILLMDRRTRK